MMMIKDNHIDFAGGIKFAIQKANKYQTEKGINIPIEIEARNISEVIEILSVGKIQRIMLDNFSIEFLTIYSLQDKTLHPINFIFIFNELLKFIKS